MCLSLVLQISGSLSESGRGPSSTMYPRAYYSTVAADNWHTDDVLNPARWWSNCTGGGHLAWSNDTVMFVVALESRSEGASKRGRSSQGV